MTATNSILLRCDRFSGRPSDSARKELGRAGEISRMNEMEARFTTLDLEEAKRIAKLVHFEIELDWKGYALTYSQFDGPVPVYLYWKPFYISCLGTHIFKHVYEVEPLWEWESLPPEVKDWYDRVSLTG